MYLCINLALKKRIGSSVHRTVSYVETLSRECGSLAGGRARTPGAEKGIILQKSNSSTSFLLLLLLLLLLAVTTRFLRASA
jgi:hypothetical protein